MAGVKVSVGDWVGVVVGVRVGEVGAGRDVADGSGVTASVGVGARAGVAVGVGGRVAVGNGASVGAGVFIGTEVSLGAGVAVAGAAIGKGETMASDASGAHPGDGKAQAMTKAAFAGSRKSGNFRTARSIKTTSQYVARKDGGVWKSRLVAKVADQSIENRASLQRPG